MRIEANLQKYTVDYRIIESSIKMNISYRMDLNIDI